MKMNKNNSGFTLIEMLVTVFVFSILMTIAGSIFVQSLDVQRRAFAIQALEENGRFSLELMAREIRFSEVKTTDTNCPANPSTTLSLVHPVNGDIQYSLRGTIISRTVDGVDQVLTSNEVEVTNLNFCVFGQTEGDSVQPRVTISMSLMAGDREPQVIDLQTTITSRLLND